MINIKHFMDAKEESDGDRLWIEPINLTKDLQEWCFVDHLLPHLGPPMELWEWFEEHPDGERIPTLAELRAALIAAYPQVGPIFA